MKNRILVALFGIPFLLVVLLVLPEFATAIFVGAMSAVAVYELLFRTGTVKHLPVVLLSSLMSIAVTFWCYLGSAASFLQPGIVVFIGLMFLLMLKYHASISFEAVCSAVFAALVLPYLFSSLVRIQMMDYGRFCILIPFVAAFCSDSGAYFVGCAIGKHKLAPNISPKKTVEGAVGGLLCGVLGVLIFGVILDFAFDFIFRYIYAVIYGIAGAAACIVGDLSFSVIKRQAGIKDYGNLLPGHGGVLDRFDSMTLVAPVIEALLIWIPLIEK